MIGSCNYDWLFISLFWHWWLVYFFPFLGNDDWLFLLSWLIGLGSYCCRKHTTNIWPGRFRDFKWELCDYITTSSTTLKIHISNNHKKNTTLTSDQGGFVIFVDNVQTRLTDFYRTQVYLGSDLWVQVSLSDYKRFCRLNWCDSGWWRYQLNSSWWYQ